MRTWHLDRRSTSHRRGTWNQSWAARRRLSSALFLSLSANVTWGCGPERESPEEAAQDLLNEVGRACSVACRVDDGCPGRWSYSGECAQECGHTIVDEFAGVAEETPCVSARFDLAYCQGDLTCAELDSLENDLPNPCTAENEQVENLCESP